MSARAWCFTINNYTDNDIMSLEKINCRYMICGFEIGENGTPHIQGYVEFGKVCRFATVKKFLPRAHIEMRRGTRDAARDYCKKDGDFFEIGDWNAGGQGRRTDLGHVREMALADGMRTVTAIGNLQQIRVAEKFLQYNEEGRDWKPTVIWLHGPTGVGKSRLARALCDGDYYAKKDGTKWWDGYDNHEEVIIDDFRDSWWSFTTMLSLLDRYEHTVECKGGSRQFRAKKIIITSAFAPEQCYKGAGEAINQLLRRIDVIDNMADVDVNKNTEATESVFDSVGDFPELEQGDSDFCNMVLQSNKVEGVILEPLSVTKNDRVIVGKKYFGGALPSPKLEDNIFHENENIDDEIINFDNVTQMKIRDMQNNL